MDVDYKHTFYFPELNVFESICKSYKLKIVEKIRYDIFDCKDEWVYVLQKC